MILGTLYYLQNIINVYLILLIGTKLIRPSATLISKTNLWISIGFAAIVQVEKVFFIEYVKQLSLLNLVIYLLIVFFLFQAKYTVKLLTFIIIVICLITSEIFGGTLLQLFSSIEVNFITLDWNTLNVVSLFDNAVLALYLLIITRFQFRVVGK